MPRKLIAGNWKMNGLRADGLRLAKSIAAVANPTTAACELLVCPPFTLLSAIREELGDAPVSVGGQDCHVETKGAHTGDISAPMLVDAGCRYVIVGHSERRHGHRETSGIVAAKAQAGLTAGLTPIVCIGETEAERASGKALSVLSEQLEQSLPRNGANEVVVAYEPVWAIGTGRTATIDDIGEAHGHIRQQLIGRLGADAASMRLLYGGSVKPNNAAGILTVPEVDGALVGGASLNAQAFLGIAHGAAA